MRKAFVAGNWKMNGTSRSARALAEGVAAGAGEGGADVVVCPPFVHLQEVAGVVAGSSVGLGGQDLSEHPAGAFTGEVSGDMLRDVGCSYVIVGHSERRHVLGESDARVAAKFHAARAVGLVPILCVGETLAERESGATESVVEAQIAAVLDAPEAGSGVASLASAVIAYEPVWAIGTGRTASPEQAEAVHAFVRELVRSRAGPGDKGLAEGLRVVYGGSVKAANAGGLFAMPNIDGGLIGGAALQAQEFLAICRAAG